MSNGAFIYYSMTLLGSWGGATFVSDVIIFRTSFGVGACLFLFGAPCKGSEKTSMIKAGSVQWGWGGGWGGRGGSGAIGNMMWSALSLLPESL